MTVAYVQSTSEVLTSGTTTFDLTLSGVAADALLIVIFKLTLQGGGTAIASVADNRNAGSYTQRVNQLNTAASSRLYAYTKAPAAAGSTTVTVTTNVSGCVGRWIVAEYSGVDANNLFDSAILSGTFAAGSPITTPNITTGAANSRVLSVISADSSTTSITPNGGETERIEVSARVQLQDKLAASAGSYAGCWSLPVSTTKESSC